MHWVSDRWLDAVVGAIPLPDPAQRWDKAEQLPEPPEHRVPAVRLEHRVPVVLQVRRDPPAVRERLVLPALPVRPAHRVVRAHPALLVRRVARAVQDPVDHPVARGPVVHLEVRVLTTTDRNEVGGKLT